MSDVIVNDTPRKSFLEEPPFDKPAITIGSITPLAQAEITKPALVDMIYDVNQRAVAALVIRAGNQASYGRIYGMLPEGARAFPLLAKTWRVYAVLTTSEWAEAKQFTPRPKGTSIEFL